MLYKSDAEQGSIIIRKPVIGRIIWEVIRRQNGRVFLSNHKGKIVQRKYRYGTLDASEYMDLLYKEPNLDIRIYISIKFGTSISMITELLIQEIKQDIERMTGLEVNSIAIVVTGLIAKQITKRNIEIKG